MDQSNILEIHDLEVVYKSGDSVVHAVNSIDLHLAEGRTLGLVGETGAGKTTTCLSVLRLLPERTAKILNGKIRFMDKDLLALSEAEMQMIRGELISMIFQDPMTALNPVMTVGKQIAEALMLHNHEKLSKKEIDRLVGEKLEMVGIPAARRNDYPHQFSGGMKQRVVIAIALACEPKLLIADEPTTALDVTIQAQVLAMINELRKRLKMSMLLITHDLGIVVRTCDDVAVMYAGEIVEYGTVEDIFTPELPHHPYTEGLFGSIPNLETESERLAPIDGLMPDPTALPQGCVFAPRCKYCTERCMAEHPNIDTEQTHQLRCHKFSGADTVGG